MEGESQHELSKNGGENRLDAQFSGIRTAKRRQVCISKKLLLDKAFTCASGEAGPKQPQKLSACFINVGLCTTLPKGPWQRETSTP